MNQNAEMEYINSLLDSEDSSIPVFDRHQGEESKGSTVVDNSQGNMYQLLSVSAFNVAIPVIEQMCIINCEKSNFSDNDLFHEGNNYHIVDVSSLINPSSLESTTGQYVLLEKRGLALLCDEILEKRMIDRETICWRNEDSQRKWLAGTVKKDNIILLDIRSLQDELNT
ncbi:MAG TPA: hypothetical protein ENJ87_08170 [Gammaproteobacteria bacterium]|nr:hypothetical protein [Gammaproteobacteria bacterium]